MCNKKEQPLRPYRIKRLGRNLRDWVGVVKEHVDAGLERVEVIYVAGKSCLELESLEVIGIIELANAFVQLVSNLITQECYRSESHVFCTNEALAVLSDSILSE